MDSKISVVIPAYNEEEAIGETIAEVRSTLEGMELDAYQIVVVDDGSTDRTGKIAEQYGADVVRHPSNGGYGISLKDGIARATHDAIVIMDADGTYPASKIPLIYEIYEEGFDMVVGAREGEHYDESFFKSILRCLLRWLVEFSSGRGVPDINSGLRIFSKKTILSYYDVLCNTFSFTTSLTLAYAMTGRFIGYTPIPYGKRRGKTKVRLFRDSLKTLQFVLEAILYFNPIKIFLLLTSIVLLFSFINLVIAALTKLAIAYILGVGSILVALLIFSLGLVAIILSKAARVKYKPYQ